MKFINDHKHFGVEPICRVLTEHGIKIAPSTYYDALDRPPSKRALREDYLKDEIQRVFDDNFGVYGARKVWLVLNREGISVARCTVERLMRQMGPAGVRRGIKRRTTVADPAAVRPADLVKRRFRPHKPNRLWVADFTYVATWSGTVYVAFVIDAYSRAIVGWRANTTMTKQLVLDALEMAMWTRDRAGITDLTGLIHHSDAGSQYTCIALTERLAAADAQPSVGTVGDALDNALAESIIGLFKTEVIKPRRPWRRLDDVEYATFEWVDWYNNRRLHDACDDLTPIEAEQMHYRHITDPDEVTPTTT